MRSLSLDHAGLLALSILAIAMIANGGIILEIYAQIDPTYPETQTTLYGDLENDPLALDILTKIEKTKNYIAKLEELETKQKEIEEKRVETLSSLQKDLEEWQKLWEEFTFDFQFEQKPESFGISTTLQNPR